MDNTMVLCSSNATKEYLLDVTETIGRPRGHIMHFRYDKKWVDQDLWGKLPVKSRKQQNPFLDFTVLTVSVYQEISHENISEWKNAYPVRFGKIKECYKTGNNEYDVAYFYFEVQNYCFIREEKEGKADLDAFKNEILRVMFKKDGSRSFAAIRQLSSISDIDEYTVSDDSAFQSTAGRFQLSHFKSPDGITQYFPVFMKIRGMDSAELSAYDPNLRQRSYELVDGNSYVFETTIYLKKSPGGSSTVELKCPGTQFVNPPVSPETIASRYDEFAWRIIPSKVIKNAPAVLWIITNIDPPPNSNYDVLNLKLSQSLLLKIHLLSRLAEIAGDIFLAIATTLLAVVGLLQKLDLYKEIWYYLILAAVILALLGVIGKGILLGSGKSK